MRQASKRVPESAEKTVRDIRRATRRHLSAEEKIRIVLEGRHRALVVTLDSFLTMNRELRAKVIEEANALADKQEGIIDDDRRAIIFCPVAGLEEVVSRTDEDGFLAYLKAARDQKYVGWEFDASTDTNRKGSRTSKRSFHSASMTCSRGGSALMNSKKETGLLLFAIDPSPPSILCDDWTSQEANSDAQVRLELGRRHGLDRLNDAATR
jgi:hypothetical protein